MQQQEKIPQYWDRLSPADQQVYTQIQHDFSSANTENRKYKSTKVFCDFITTLKGFVMQGDDNDKNRALVCGIYWFGNTIAINTRQMMTLISKCKSSINGSFQALGYGTIPTGANSAMALIRLFPHLANNFSELRQWTVRQLLAQTPAPSKLAQLMEQTYKPQHITPPPSGTSYSEQTQPTGMTISLTNTENQLNEIASSLIENPQTPNKEQDLFMFDTDDISNFLWGSDYNDFSSVY